MIEMERVFTDSRVQDEGRIVKSHVVKRDGGVRGKFIPVQTFKNPRTEFHFGNRLSKDMRMDLV